MQTPTKKLSVTNLRAREEMWRILWGWIDEDVKKFVKVAGTTVRIMQLNYMGKVGELGQVKFEPKEIEVIIYEKVYDPTGNKYFYEQKIIQYPWNKIAWIETILESIPAEEVEKVAVEALDWAEGES